MSNFSKVCPVCNSADVRFRAKRNDWFCDACDHRWTTGETDSSAPAKVGRAKLFLSYGRRDAKTLADRLCDDLEAVGYEVWQDTREIRSGRAWEQEIRDGLHSTQIMVAVLSPHAVRLSADPDTPDQCDGVCLDEISFARFSRPPRPIVPVMAVACETPLSIFRLDYVDLTSWQESDESYQAGLQQLLDGIRAGLNNEPRFRVWEQKLKPWDFAGYLDQKRQGFVGREWLFDELESWRTSTRDRALLITGDPGTGKSAIAAQLVHREGGQVLAYHCCRVDDRETLAPWRFIRSIAAMIATRLPDYASQLDTPEVDTALNEASCRTNPIGSFDRGILGPLQKLPAPSGGVRYLLVDALDESLMYEGATNLVDLLSARWTELPDWLRIVATTRRHPDVLKRLSALPAEQLDAHDRRNLDDVDRYIRYRLDRPSLTERLVHSKTNLDEATMLLRERSEGNFLYVEQALDGLEAGQFHFDSLSELPPGLYGLYFEFFRRHFPDAASFELPRQVLQVVVAAREPLSERLLGTASGLDSRSELATTLRRLRVYIPPRADQDGKIKYAPYHKSLADWLTDDEQRGDLYYCDPITGHERLAEACFNEHLQGATRLSPYVMSHLPIHLIAAERWDELETALTDLRFVKAKCSAGRTFDLVRDYTACLDAIPELQGQRDQDHERLQRLQQYGSDLITSSKSGSPGAVASSPDTRETLEQIRRSEADSAEADSAQASGGQFTGSRSARIQAFANFVSTHSHLLDRMPDQTLSIAYNYASGGPVVEQAAELLDSVAIPWLRRAPRPAPPGEKPLCIRTLAGHADRVTSVALTFDGALAVSGSEDRTLGVWDVGSGELLRTLVGHDKWVTAVALTPDGTMAVSAGEDMTVRVWDVHNGTLQRTLEGHTDRVSGVALTPDGIIAVSSSWDKTVRVWHVSNGKLLRTLTGHSGWVTSVAISADGCTTVSASGDGTIRVWNVATGELVRELEGHTAAVIGVALVSDGSIAVSTSWDKTIRVWDVAAGKLLSTLEGHTDWGKSVAITPDARLAVSAGQDQTVRVWDVGSGDLLRTLEGDGNAATAVAVTPDGRTLMSASNSNSLHVFDVADGKRRAKLDCESKPITALALSVDGNIAVSASHAHTLHSWDAATGQRQKVLEGHEADVTGVALTSDGRLGVSSSGDATVRVWDVADGTLQRTLRGHTRGVTAVALSADGSIIASGSRDRSLRLWDVSSGELRTTLVGHASTIKDVAFTPDGETVISASRDGTLRVWDVNSGTVRTTLEGHTSVVRSVAITPDGSIVISASFDTTVRVWDLRSGSLLRTLEGNKDEGVTAISITLDGKTALSGNEGRTLCVWDIGSGRLVAVYPMDSPCWAVASAADNQFVAGTQRGQLHFLTLQNGEIPN